VAAPVEIIQTTQTVRTYRAAPLHPVRRQVVTTRIAPLYDAAPAAAVSTAIAPAPIVAAPVVTAPVVAAPVATQPVIYRYVYEPDRILVIDPVTNIAVQAVPR
jgi:2-oxoglutarate dehydrogenase E2 component (dihydrolipoamide succinyltransferase)